MPYFKLDTNVSKDKVTKKLLKSTAKVIASTLGKTENNIIVQINADQPIVWGDSEAPFGYATLMSVHLGDSSKELCAVIYAHLEKHLGIAKDRLCIHFIDAPPSTVGFNGTTVEKLYENN